MMFKNPRTGATESLSDQVWLWVLLFGFFYFASKRVWTQVLAHLLFAIVTFGLSWLIYPFLAFDLMHKHYRKKGWIEVPEEA